MERQLCISVMFLDPLFHGKGDQDEPEWPPAPFRLFQALIAGSRISGRANSWSDSKAESLRWLERMPPPQIVAPVRQRASSYIKYVPNNDSDSQFDRLERLTEKIVRPQWMLGESTEVHYLWPLVDPVDELYPLIDLIGDLARSVLALGWGVDMAIARAAILSKQQTEALLGERWLPATHTEGGWRVPKAGSFDDLTSRHKRFLTRVGRKEFAAPLPPSVYANVEYRRAIDPAPRPVAAFSLLKLDASGFRAFDTTGEALRIAGMMRCAAKVAAVRSGWPESKINRFILGHGDLNDVGAQIPVGPKRFAYLPLPSIEFRGSRGSRIVGNIRRLMLSSFDEGSENEIGWARRALAGQELTDEDSKESTALLSLIATDERVVQWYTRASTTWATVMPVVLPGYDDPRHYRRRMKQRIPAEEQKRLLVGLADRIEGLLRRAITQAGYSQELAEHAKLEWRKTGFWPGTDAAERYGVPHHLKRFPLYHVKIQWRDARDVPVSIPGPICIGGGRFYGLGLFAALES